MTAERLQKILARAGLGSRRASEEFIIAGRVTVNGEVATLGSKADPMKDRILLDGHLVASPEPMVYIMLYKPRGVLSAVSSPDPRPTVRNLVNVPEHLYPVGRLDVDSEGLIIMTNDGELANHLTHPRYGHEKEYRVLVARRPDEEQLATWRRGVVLEDGYHTAPAEVRIESLAGKGTWLRVILREGRKRQIRETGNLIGLPVVKIIRVRIGPVQIGNLKPKEWRMLTPQEVAALKGKAEKHVAPAKPGIPKKRKEPGKSRVNKSTKAIGPERQDKPFKPGRQNKPGKPPVKRRSAG